MFFGRSASNRLIYIDDGNEPIFHTEENFADANIKLAHESKLGYNGKYRVSPGVAQLVARVVWDHQAAGSNPVTRTKKVSFVHRTKETFEIISAPLETDDISLNTKCCLQ